MKRIAHRLAFVTCLASLAACGVLGGSGKPAREKPEPVVSHPTADGEAVRSYLAALAELQSGAPAAQAEVFQAARLATESAPTTLNRLRYALMLALPGHAGSDPVAARRQLSDLVARPELLLPSERALAVVFLAEVDERLVSLAENRRLQQDAAGRDKDRSAALSKRLQAEMDDNARLRRALEEAQKKLDAVTQVERSITGRGNPPKP
jgi:predicted small lipoprotein YifL